MNYLAGLQKGARLGGGVFGEVFLCIDPVQGQVAAKHFYAANFATPAAWQEVCEKALAEAQALKALEHCNIVRVHQVLLAVAGSEFLIVTEYCEERSARDKTSANSFTLKQMKHIAREAAIGLNYIHGQGYLHRDIKPDNILLKSNGEVKVGDFGFVTDQLQFGFATPYGTPAYWAPEVRREKACTDLSDVYALGMTLLNLVSGDHWFFRKGRGQIFREDADGYPLVSGDMLFLPHIITAWRNTIARLIRADKVKRCASMAEAVNLISRLPVVEDWTCDVGPDEINWKMEKDGRRFRVRWENYLRDGESWIAWSEAHNGSAKRTLAKSNSADKWPKKYRSLQLFFEKRSPKYR